MAIQFGAYGQGTAMPTAADEYAGQAAMLPDLGAEFEKGRQRVKDEIDRQRQIEKDEIDIAQAKLDYDTDFDAWNQKLAERTDLDDDIRALTMASESYNQDVCASAALTVGESNPDCTDGLPSGWQKWSDEKKKKFLSGIEGFRGQMDAGKALAEQYSDPNFLTDKGIDPNDPANKEMVAVANNFSKARKGNCRTVSGTESQVCDIIVNTPDGDVTIKDGDVEAYFNDAKKSPSVTNIDNAIDFNSLLGVQGHDFADEVTLETKKAKFAELFQGENAKYSLQSFESRFPGQDPTSHTPWTLDDAWQVYSATKIAELKASGHYGQPTAVTDARLKTEALRLKNQKTREDIKGDGDTKDNKAGVVDDNGFDALKQVFSSDSPDFNLLKQVKDKKGNVLINDVVPGKDNQGNPVINIERSNGKTYSLTGNPKEDITVLRSALGLSEAQATELLSLIPEIPETPKKNSGGWFSNLFKKKPIPMEDINLDGE